MFDPEILLKIPKVYKGQVLKSFGELTKNLVKRKGGILGNEDTQTVYKCNCLLKFTNCTDQFI